ncbi:MAG: hypothetical protein KQI35_16380 [Bacteroidetes bacterium]|nr:hypothetical protein [Bacteroidota bacterium]
MFLIIGFPFILLAQTAEQRPSPYANYLGVSGDFGLTTFYGDLDENSANGQWWQNNKAYQLQILRNFNALFELNGRISFGNISGHKNKESQIVLSNRYFKTKFIEYTIDASVNLLGFFTLTKRKRIGLYGKIGIGLIDFKTKLYSGVNDSLIQSLGYDGEATTEMVIPFGLKVIYHLSKSSALSFQTTSSRVSTDKLDAVSGNYNSDYYNFISIGFTYKFAHDQSLRRLFGQHPSESIKRKPGRANPSRRR